jgi:hypothetical protein
MATILLLLLLLLIFNGRTIFAEFYRIVSFDQANQTDLQNDICYMTNTKTNQWCELITSEIILPTIKTCVSINESLPILEDFTNVDQVISATNCSYFLSSSMTETQRCVLIIIQSIFLFFLFFPFIFKLSSMIIRYAFK